ncbi:MAG: hypothetical protein U9O98_00040, partial [Asgard group archaeon]|nr:hypothetical protein [Asgard group archaeon]
NDTIAFTVTSIGQYMNTTEDTDLFIYHRMRFDYSVSEYNLLGYRMNSNINGTYEGTESDFHMLLEVKLSTYTRRLGPTNIFIGITALFIFGTFVIIKKRRK